jgi:hypothetical protein
VRAARNHNLQPGVNPILLYGFSDLTARGPDYLGAF